MITALVGEIYPEIVMIGVRWNKNKGEFTLRYYIDREPTEYDYESISVVSANFYAHLNEFEDKNIKKYVEQCVYYTKGDKIPDDHFEFGLLYGRRNYET